MLDVTIYGLNGEVVQTFHSEDSEAVDYVSLVSNETYGPPALVAPTRGSDSRSSIGESVLYINTHLVPMWEIVRVSD